MLMFDTLARQALPPYGCDWVAAPNFAKLAERAVVFDNCYAGSLPCMPARRELHTGRYNFLHRAWGPLEPFDDSMPQLLRENGTYTHLVSDHFHYWEDGGATYHTRYDSWEICRGSQRDPWQGKVAKTILPESGQPATSAQAHTLLNRQQFQREEDYPIAKTYRQGMDFIRRNHQEDNWFLQIETFAPHEPFLTPPKYKELYPGDLDGARRDYAAFVSMCDYYLGQVCALMDELGMWDDTALIVNTDHGSLLGAHGAWGKRRQPVYSEIARIPLFIWDPRGACRGERRESLVQTIDLAPTLLEMFGVELPAAMQGRPLRDVVATDAPIRDGALFGYHGGHVNCTDGRYVYMRAPASADNTPLFNYTLLPLHKTGPFSDDALRRLEAVGPLPFTNGAPVLRAPATAKELAHRHGTLLFDLANDAAQEHPISDPAVEARMTQLLVESMRANDAPAEQYERLGLDADPPGA